MFKVIDNNILSARKTGRPKYDVIFPQGWRQYFFGPT